MFDVFVKSVCAIAAMCIIAWTVLGVIGWMQFTSQIETLSKQWQNSSGAPAASSAPAALPASAIDHKCLAPWAKQFAEARDEGAPYANMRRWLFDGDFRINPNNSKQPYADILAEVYKYPKRTPKEFFARYTSTCTAEEVALYAR